MKDKSIISVDFQGWPVRKMCVRNIIMALGAKFNNDTNKFEIDNDPELLNTYPVVLEDDGMGYGVDDRFVTEVSPFTDEEGNKCVNIFAEYAMSEEELEKQLGHDYNDNDVFQLTPSKD